MLPTADPMLSTLYTCHGTPDSWNNSAYNRLMNIHRQTCGPAWATVARSIGTISSISLGLIMETHTCLHMKRTARSAEKNKPVGLSQIWSPHHIVINLFTPSLPAPCTP